MCGIAGVVNWGDINSLRRMADVQSHRGPDDSGIWTTHTRNSEWIGLASRRLSILDLSVAGHMPMTTSDGRFTIVYNGECYNYSELRRDLESKAYVFRSNSDTEALLYAYQEYGHNCVRGLNGMFAFAVWDKEREELFLARDHFGIKPLYYSFQNGRFCFASEMKSLFALPDMEVKFNYEAIHQYLSMLWVPDPLTVCEGIYKIPAGHHAIWKAGKLSIQKYWDLTFPSAGEFPHHTEETLCHEVKERFCRSVRSQLMSDVPVGAFLSAGLDSSGIVAAMAKYTQSPVRTFTIGFPPDYTRGEVMMDDIAVARRTAEIYGCRHTEIIVRPDVLDLLPRLIYHMDEPTADPQIIMSYLVCREASKQVTVLLSGLGGDEVFAGYRKHRAHQLAQYYQRLPLALRRNLIEPAFRVLPTMQGTRAKGYVRLAKKMIRSGSLPPHERFLRDSLYLDSAQLQVLCTDEFSSRVAGHDPFAAHRRHFDQVSHADFLNQMLYLDTKTFMVSLNLNVADKTSMASSVETRVPFLDRDLVQWVASNVPPGFKLHGGTTKYIYRRALADMLPPEVLRQKKAGFTAPIDVWLANDLKDLLKDVLSPDRLKRHGIFDPNAVLNMLKEQSTGIRDWTYPIWQVLTLELWMDTFVGNTRTALMY